MSDFQARSDVVFVDDDLLRIVCLSKLIGGPSGFSLGESDRDQRQQTSCVLGERHCLGITCVRMDSSVSDRTLDCWVAGELGLSVVSWRADGTQPDREKDRRRSVRLSRLCRLQYTSSQADV